jgi:DNA-directed RNA polymerase specialized sigma24 family protein
VQILQNSLIAEGLDDLKETVYNTVVHFWLHTGGELNDLHQDALLEFVRCYHDWQPDRAQFKTLLINRIRYRLTDKARVELSRRKKLRQVELLDYPCKERSFNLEDFIDCLSDDARMLVLLAFEMHGLSDHRPHEIRNGLRACLRQAEWAHKRIRNAFREIRRLL